MHTRRVNPGPAVPVAVATLLLSVLAPPTAAGAQPATVTAPHVQVSYDGVPEGHAKCVAETLSAAREAYAQVFGFVLPETIRCSVEVGAGKPTRLFTDGNDRVFLSAPSPDKLLRPQKSGTFVVYGMCHELGHVAMYRILKDRDWMTGAAAEGWAHYAGSVVVDRVYEARGKALWSIDPYEFKADGTARLDRNLAGKSPGDVDRAAGLWRELANVVGPAEIKGVFEAWQAAQQDSTASADLPDRLLDAAVKGHADKAAALKQWWAKASPVFVDARPASAFAKKQLDRGKLEGRALALADDDGSSDGKRSIAGGGHARRFVAPGGGEWYLTGVSVFGSRYGPAQAPAGATFDVALCDAEMKPVAMWKQPQSMFPRGEAKWVKITIPATRVPPGDKGFYLCLNFRPSATQGVFVHFDSSTQGKSEGSSLTATPGKMGEPFAGGDWMIRVELDRPKAADALGGK